MWTIEAREVLSLTGGSGEPFARFVNAVIRAHCYSLGIPDNQVSTTVRTNYPDGGVDAAVHDAIAGDASGRMTVPTAWQFKAEPLSRISDKKLREEIGKPYARDLISKGYGYRFCLCDDPSDERKAGCLNLLNDKARTLTENPSPVQVLTASDLGNWASRFPAIAGNIFGRPLGIALHWNAWVAAETKVTRNYVLPPGWKAHLEAIRDQLDFTKSKTLDLLTVQGAAGVGKTRLVLEAVRLPSMAQTCRCTSLAMRCGSPAVRTAKSARRTG